VQRGWLTSFQAEQVLAGHAQQLILGGYRLLQLLGTGGMGEVFKAWQQRLNRVVAIKVIRPDLLAQNPGTVRRFRREALAVAQLSHPNIVVIYDADEADGAYFLVMEYVDGPDLDRLVTEGSPLPVPLACEYVRQAALGLQHAHDAGLVHRDIKPSNLLVARPQGNRNAQALDVALAGDMNRLDFKPNLSHGLVKILDMGLARMESALDSRSNLTREGIMMGTPDYVAPEQARDASSVDFRADLYSLGCTFYFLLTGQPPFPEGTMMEKLMKHQLEKPVPVEKLRSNTPPMVRAVIRRLMAKKPEDRFTTASELAHTLSEILGVTGLPPVLDMAPVPDDSTSAVSAEKVDALPVPVPVENGAAKQAAPQPVTPTGSGRFPVVVGSRAFDNPRDTPADRNGLPPVTVVTAVSLQDDRGDPMHEIRQAFLARKSSVVRGHSGPVMATAFSPDGQLLATGGLDSTVRIWRLSNPPREQAEFRETRLGDLQVLAFAPTGDSVVTGSASLDARMWQWRFRENIDRERVPFEGAPSYSDALAFSPDGALLASAVGPSLWLWVMNEGVPRKRTILKNDTGEIKAILFSRDNKMLVSGDEQGDLQFWKMGWLGVRPGSVLQGHHGGVTTLAYSTDGQLLASAGQDRTVLIWDGSGNVPKAKCVLKDLLGIVRQMMFLPDPRYLLTITHNGQVVLWLWETGIPEYEWRLDQKIICSLALSCDGSTVAAGNSDGTVTLFDLVPE
jgi:serine/threonine-protein kinase